VRPDLFSYPDSRLIFLAGKIVPPCSGFSVL